MRAKSFSNALDGPLLLAQRAAIVLLYLRRIKYDEIKSNFKHNNEMKEIKLTHSFMQQLWNE